MSDDAKQERPAAAPAGRKRGDFIRGVRAEASGTAYRTALDWMRRLPAEEVLRRLEQKIEEKDRDWSEAQKKS
jgi:hypothetical protein